MAAVDRELAEIIVKKQSACGACEVRSGCGTSLLANWLPRRRLVFHLKNDIGAKPGDTVVLGLDETLLQRGSLLLYALPVAGLLMGAVAGEAFFPLLGLSAELGAVLTGLFGVTAALAQVRRIASNSMQGGDGGVRLLRVINSPVVFAPGEIAVSKVDQSEKFGTSK